MQPKTFASGRIRRADYDATTRRLDLHWAELEERLAQFDTTAGWVGPRELLLTAARR